jgi:hypothetical protein
MLQKEHVDQLTDFKMAAQPTQDQIRQVCEITFLGDKEALILLKKNHGDVPRAIEAYYSDMVGSIKEDVGQYHRGIICLC